MKSTRKRDRKKRGGAFALPTKQSPRPARRPREPVVVELLSDGFVQVYGAEHVDIQIVNRLHVALPEAADLLDEYVEWQLPGRHRAVYWPNKCRAVGQVRRVRPSDEYERLADLELLKAIREAREERPT